LRWRGGGGVGGKRAGDKASTKREGYGLTKDMGERCSRPHGLSERHTHMLEEEEEEEKAFAFFSFFPEAGGARRNNTNQAPRIEKQSWCFFVVFVVLV
jgi:hypothetical protein